MKPVHKVLWILFSITDVFVHVPGPMCAVPEILVCFTACASFEHQAHVGATCDPFHVKLLRIYLPSHSSLSGPQPHLSWGYVRRLPRHTWEVAHQTRRQLPAPAFAAVLIQRTASHVEASSDVDMACLVQLLQAWSVTGGCMQSQHALYLGSGTHRRIYQIQDNVGVV